MPGMPRSLPGCHAVRERARGLRTLHDDVAQLPRLPRYDQLGASQACAPNDCESTRHPSPPLPSPARLFHATRKLALKPWYVLFAFYHAVRCGAFFSFLVCLHILQLANNTHTKETPNILLLSIIDRLCCPLTLSSGHSAGCSRDHMPVETPRVRPHHWHRSDGRA